MGFSRQKGFALISALWLIVLMTVIAGALSWTSRQSIISTGAIVGGVQARYLADGAAQLVYANLLQRLPAQRLLADGEILELKLPGGEARVKVTDENGKVDINAAQQPLLARLLYSLDVEKSQADALADAIIDYRDDNSLRHLNGAEDDDYRVAGLSWEAKDSPFTSIGELRKVYGMDEVIYDAVRPYVTIYARHQGVNPEVASLPVLIAISNDSVSTLEAYIERRRQNHAEGIALPRQPVVDRRFLSRTRGLTYNLVAIGMTERDQSMGVTTTIRLGRARGKALIETLAWGPYVRSDADEGTLFRDLTDKQRH